MPLFGPLFQLGVDLAGLGDVVTSGRQRQRDEVGLLAGDDRAALGAAGAVRALERDALAGSGVFCEALAERVVGGLDHGEADDVHLLGSGGLVAARRTRARGVSPARPEGERGQRQNGGPGQDATAAQAAARAPAVGGDRLRAGFVRRGHRELLGR